eukprot:g59.t1
MAENNFECTEEDEYKRRCKRLGLKPVLVFSDSLREARGLQGKMLCLLNDLPFSLVDEDLRCIASTLSLNTSLGGVDLGGNSLTSNGVKALCVALQNNNTLHTLSLASNPLGDEGLFALAEILCSPIIDYATAVVERNRIDARGITSLNLSDTNLTYCGVSALATAVAAGSSLRKLYLEHNNLTSDAAICLASALRGSFDLKRKNQMQEEQLSQLTVLSLAYNCIGDEGSRAIFASLGSIPAGSSLIELDLSCNNLSKDGVDRLAQALSCSTKLLSLALRGNPALSLAFSSLSIALGQSHLKYFDLNGIPVNETSASTVGRVIANLETLRMIGLSGVTTTSAVNALAASLDGCRCLTSVKLSSQVAKEAAALRIRELCESNKKMLENGSCSFPKRKISFNLSSKNFQLEREGKLKTSNYMVSASADLSLDSITDKFVSREKHVTLNAVEAWCKEMNSRWRSHCDAVLKSQSDSLHRCMRMQNFALEQLAQEVRWIDEESTKARIEESSSIMMRISSLMERVEKLRVPMDDVTAMHEKESSNEFEEGEIQKMIKNVREMQENQEQMISSVLRQLQNRNCDKSQIEKVLKVAEENVGLNLNMLGETAKATALAEAAALRNLANQISEAISRLRTHMITTQRQSISATNAKILALNNAKKQQQISYQSVVSRLDKCYQKVIALEDSVIMEQGYSLQALQTILQIQNK